MRIYSTKNKVFTKRQAKSWLLAFVTVLASGYFSLFAQSTNPNPYCAPTHPYNTSSCQNQYVTMTSVELNTLKKTETCPSTRGVYSYWNAGQSNTTNISKGANYTINLGAYALYNWQMHFGVWIDYNQNNTFDANEFLGNISAVSGGIASRNFTVPCSAQTGKTRMRVRLDYFRQYSGGMACGQNSYGYGETWDFDVTIDPINNPTADFVVPDTVYTNAPARFVNVNRTGYISHEWDLLNIVVQLMETILISITPLPHLVRIN